MNRSALTRIEQRTIDAAIEHFLEHQHLFTGFAESLLDKFQSDAELSTFIHFIKSRIKSEARLRSKLKKKALEQKRGQSPKITADNLFTKINDLAGIRIIHLHTTQLEEINRLIQRILIREQWEIVEGPIANCWDVEYENLYKEYGITPASMDSLYSSVHYILQANKKTKVTIELQIRTLMEEVWGEVSHRVGYEEPPINDIVAKQLKVLARLTSGSTRLVDCIFDTYQSAEMNEATI